MPDRQHFNADPRSEHARHIEENDSGRDRLQVTRLGILFIERVDPDPNFACLHEVGDAGVGSLFRLGEAWQDGCERKDENQFFHACLQESDLHRKRSRPHNDREDTIVLSYTASDFQASWRRVGQLKQLVRSPSGPEAK